MFVQVLPAKLIVTPDNSTPGSEGRLYLQFPAEMAEICKQRYRVYGYFSLDNAIMLVHHKGLDGLVVTPRRQLWWKNGVRDHGIRENWHVNVFVLEHDLLVVVLDKPTGETLPKLPPRQETLFK